MNDLQYEAGTGLNELGNGQELAFRPESQALLQFVLVEEGDVGLGSELGFELFDFDDRDFVLKFGIHCCVLSGYLRFDRTAHIGVIDRVKWPELCPKVWVRETF